MTDVEYSRALRDWLNTVRLPASNLLGPAPRFMVIDPGAASFKSSCIRTAGQSPMLSTP
jgi:hypothetical protein